MIKTKRAFSIRDIPSEWMFEYYLNLDTKLTGQSVKIKSIFNSKDSNPSMNLFYSEKYKNYRFFDFSSGQEGGCLDLITLLNPGVSLEVIYNKVFTDYINNNGQARVSETIKRSFSVSEFTLRKWNTDDKKFWTQYNIGSDILARFNVIALKDYTCVKTTGSEEEIWKVSKNYCYGYFTKSGELHKIYSPDSDLKFLTLKVVAQGLDQLEGKPYLIIGSSLKDILSIVSMTITNLDVIAPASETTYFDETLIYTLKKSYKKIITLFDNDQPGINAMDRYEKLYGFPKAHLKLSKDLSDSVKDFGVDKTRNELLILLKQIIHG